MHAVGRLALHPWITNVQASWVKLGLDGAQRRAARRRERPRRDADERVHLARRRRRRTARSCRPSGMEEAIRATGRMPRQRTTLYGDRRTRSARALVLRRAGLTEPLNPQRQRRGLKRPPRLVRPGLAVSG